MTAPQPSPDEAPSGPIADLVATIGTVLTFTGTVTHSSYLAGFQRGVMNRRLVVEDHGVTVKTIVGSGWASDIHQGDTVTIRGPIKGYEIEPRGLVIVLQRTRPLHIGQPEPEEHGDGPLMPGWPPAPRSGVRQRFRSRHEPLLRPNSTIKADRPPKGKQ